MNELFEFFLDPVFAVLSVLVLASAAVFLWCVKALVSSKKDSRTPPVPAKPSGSSPSVGGAKPSSSPPVAPQKPGPPQGGAPVPLMEDRLAELTKRLNALEAERKNAKDTASIVPALLDPLLKRVQGLESELMGLKRMASDLTSGQGGQGKKAPSEELSALSKKVDGLQKVLEDLTAKTEVSKVS